MRVRSLGGEDPLEEEMATHSSILAWRIPWTEEPGGLQSMGLQKSGTGPVSACVCMHTHTHTHAHWNPLTWQLFQLPRSSSSITEESLLSPWPLHHWAAWQVGR